jgi:hypothetical protein
MSNQELYVPNDYLNQSNHASFIILYGVCNFIFEIILRNFLQLYAIIRNIQLRLVRVAKRLSQGAKAPETSRFFLGG